MRGRIAALNVRQFVLQHQAAALFAPLRRIRRHEDYRLQNAERHGHGAAGAFKRQHALRDFAQSMDIEETRSAAPAGAPCRDMRKASAPTPPATRPASTASATMASFLGCGKRAARFAVTGAAACVCGNALPAVAVAVARNTRFEASGRMDAPIRENAAGMRREGKETESSGNASSAAKAAVQTR